MNIGQVYKMKINNGIDREPYYMIMKIWSGDYIVFWNKIPGENISWLRYETERVEANIEKGLWELIEINHDFTIKEN